MKEWPFQDPRNLATFTTWPVVRRRSPILTVYHNADDGLWQFLDDNGGRERDIKEAALVALEEIVELDPSVVALADLPRGWCAWRASVNDEWNRRRCE